MFIKLKKTFFYILEFKLSRCVVKSNNKSWFFFSGLNQIDVGKIRNSAPRFLEFNQLPQKDVRIWNFDEKKVDIFSIDYDDAVYKTENSMYRIADAYAPHLEPKKAKQSKSKQTGKKGKQTKKTISYRKTRSLLCRSND